MKLQKNIQEAAKYEVPALLMRGLFLLLIGLATSISPISRQVLAAGPQPVDKSKDGGLVLIEEYKAPGSEVELSGIHPHPTNDDLYFVAANSNPSYRKGEKSVLPAEYRGKLLTVNRRTGKIIKAFDLGKGEYGGIGYGENTLFVSSLEPAEILQVNLQNGEILRRIPLSSPAGGLKYDKERSQLIAQLFIGFPHLAVVDLKTGATVQTLWSDESAMDIAKVNGDWLCTWASGFDKQAMSELRLLDSKTGKVKGRLPLKGGVHSSMAPLDKQIAGVEGFICLVADRKAGKTTIRRYAYNKDKVDWRA
jgi:hypothetical protein